MNQRVEIKIAIVGDAESGKETFNKMMFLTNDSKIRVDPLSKISEIFMETDAINFKLGTQKIIEECTKQNNLIMKQTQINEITDLRKNGIQPFFYRHTPRVNGLINYDDPNTLINKNILLTFYSIRKNCVDFTKEIDAANVIIYIIDLKKDLSESNYFSYFADIISKSNGKKYLITLVNKCDDLNENGEFPSTSENSKIIENINKFIKEYANKSGQPQNLFPAIPISLKYASVFRNIMLNKDYELLPDDQILIANQFGIKKELINRDQIKNKYKYYLKCTGFSNFRQSLLDVLNRKFTQMIDDNFNSDIENTLQLLNKYETINNSPVKALTEFIDGLEIMKNKSVRLTKIFKKDYIENVINLSKKFLNIVKNICNSDAEINLIDRIKNMFRDYSEVVIAADLVKNELHNRWIQKVNVEIYSDNMTIEMYYPNKIQPMFDVLINSSMSREESVKLAKRICKMYVQDTKNFSKNKKYLTMLYNFYFTENETNKLIMMFDEIKSMLPFEEYKNNLIQLFLTKLIIVQTIIENSSCISNECINECIMYCNSLKYYLSENIHKKYDYLFTLISDICINVISKHNKPINQINYISENIDSIINFKFGSSINLDKFVIKMIKKTNYQAVIADDQFDSDEDSDIDVYGESNDFTFTNDDFADSNDEDENDFDEINTPVHKFKKSQTKKSGNKKRLVEV
jgi:hypothetical protein